ncbi:Protein of unknown function [Pyronema omphalodes CBS 100304]|uniref:Uncharacterized protein n=1 Tax=Pyronema omphalodes (strain CBS 100304) TaxID=1076935 RepID=U4LSX3_PYROM|nr:Protein of unknown function [Pyronema omphalodes CBS 100304]
MEVWTLEAKGQRAPWVFYAIAALAKDPMLYECFDLKASQKTVTSGEVHRYLHDKAGIACVSGTETSS